MRIALDQYTSVLRAGYNGGTGHLLGTEPPLSYLDLLEPTEAKLQVRVFTVYRLTNSKHGS